MKIRNLLAVVAMLSVFIIGIGTAHAVLGVNDDVPQQDLAIPLICEKGGQLDTLFAIADKDEAACHYADTDVVTRASVYIYDYQSRFLQDTIYEWTKHDVVTDTCSNLVDTVAGNPPQAEVILNGRTYYVIYAVVQQLNGGDIPFQGGDPTVCSLLPTNRFIAWEYLVDLSKGFASGFNAPGAENGLGAEFNEELGNAPIAVATFLPRYYFLNDKAETWNWWMYFFGRNELAIENSILFSNVHRNLSGIICDEQENCFSLIIPIPYELNIINVLPKITPAIKTINGFPAHDLGGFAILDIVESGMQSFPQIGISIFGTYTNGFLLDPFEYYSGHAWSYQREASNDDLPGLSWDVVHPQHRIWCTVSDPINGADCGASTTEQP